MGYLLGVKFAVFLHVAFSHPMVFFGLRGRGACIAARFDSGGKTALSFNISEKILTS
jgi:hypothetical protein